MHYDRKEKKMVEEAEGQKKILALLYNTYFGRTLLQMFVAQPWFTNMIAHYHKSKYSAKDIVPFIKKHNIDIDEQALGKFKSFNDFFTRAKPIRCGGPENELIAIATSKLSYFKITDDLKLSIKQSQYTIEDILQDNEMAEPMGFPPSPPWRSTGPTTRASSRLPSRILPIR